LTLKINTIRKTNSKEINDIELKVKELEKKMNIIKEKNIR